MKKEEAIETLGHVVPFATQNGEKIAEAIDMAIEALTYQILSKPNNTCEVDLISRADAIEAIQNAYCKPCKERGDDYYEVRCRACAFDDAIIQIDALSSAEPHNKDAISREGLLRLWEELSPRGRLEFDQVIMTIPALPSAEAEWIPVSERLPNTNGIYIVTRRRSDGFECRNLTDACYFDGTSTWHDDTRVNHERKYLTDVLAWTPLPKPYKAESEEV